jgi:hypothetical protein
MVQSYRFQILAPPDNHPSDAFSGARIDDEVYSQQLASLQSLRGRVYLQDHAIQPWELDVQSRFPMPGDDLSWHFLLTDDEQEVIGCVRYLVHPQTISFNKLLIAHSSMVSNAEWHDKVREAVEADLKLALEQHLSYVEIGGWALAEAWRGTSAALEILVASYALGNLWGGCLGSCTATVRHSSSSILRRIGGSRFQVRGESLPPYEDPSYGCEMELLRFDSRSPARRFIPLISQVEEKLANTVAMVRTGSKDFTKSVFGVSEERPFANSAPSHVVPQPSPVRQRGVFESGPLPIRNGL